MALFTLHRLPMRKPAYATHVTWAPAVGRLLRGALHSYRHGKLHFETPSTWDRYVTSLSLTTHGTSLCSRLQHSWPSPSGVRRHGSSATHINLRTLPTPPTPSTPGFLRTPQPHISRSVHLSTRADGQTSPGTPRPASETWRARSHLLGSCRDDTCGPARSTAS